MERVTDLWFVICMMLGKISLPTRQNGVEGRK